MSSLTDFRATDVRDPVSERPPQTPCDPPDPAPQADAWRRALKVVTAETARRLVEVPKTRMGRNLARRH